MMDVVSVTPSPEPRASGFPQCEQKRAPWGFS
jgi:hypothetical protein